MATVTVEVNGRPYSVGCADGQEERVRLLARDFDAHVRSVAEDVGQVGDLKLFLMGALMLADQLHEVRIAGPGSLPAPAQPPVQAPHPAPAEGVAEALNAVAARIEKIVQSI